MMMRYLSERSSRFPRNPTVSYVEHPLLEESTGPEWASEKDEARLPSLAPL